jgi:hypothetical protein
MVGGERAMLAALAGEPPFGARGSNPLGAFPPSPRSNRHLHHRLAGTCASAIEKTRWGTGDIGASNGITGAPFGRPALWRVATLARAPPQCVRQRRCSVRCIRHLHHQRRLSRAHSLTRQTRLLLRRRGAADGRTPKSSLCHRYPAHRLVPSGRPRALGPRAFPREPPGSGSPVPACAGIISNEPRLLENLGFGILAFGK